MNYKINRIALLVLLIPISLWSQFEDSRIGAGVLVGGTKLYGDITETNTEFTAGVLVNYQPIPYFALTTSATRGRVTTGLNAIKTELLNLNLFATLYAFPHGKFRPLGMVGFSFFRYNAKDGNGNQLFRNDGTAMKSWERAFQIGAGFEIMAAAPWAMTVMFNYNVTGIDELDAITQGNSDGFLNGFVGLVRYFNLRKKPVPHHDMGKRAEVVTTKQTEAPSVGSSDTGEYTDGIYFEPGSARLLNKSREKLTKLYEFLLHNPKQKIQLVGTAADTVQASLMTRRAKAVKQYLVQKGIAANRIVISTK